MVHCEAVGSGLGALKYLAPYIFRVAICNNRILKLEEDRVTFRYRDTETSAERYCTLEAEDFIHRFLQHVLPKGFVKVRYYGLFSPGLRKQLGALQQQLHQATSTPSSLPQIQDDPSQANSQPTQPVSSTYLPPCPVCGRPMQLSSRLPPSGLSPP